MNLSLAERNPRFTHHANALREEDQVENIVILSFLYNLLMKMLCLPSGRSHKGAEPRRRNGLVDRPRRLQQSLRLRQVPATNSIESRTPGRT